MPQGKRQNLGETDRGSCYNQGEWLEFLDDKGAFHNGSEIDSENHEENCDKKYRSSCLQMFSKIGTLKSFTNFTGKHLCWSTFLIKLRP